MVTSNTASYAALGVSLVIFLYFSFLDPGTGITPLHIIKQPAHDVQKPFTVEGAHPINRLIGVANEDFQRLLSRPSSNVDEAAKIYRERRGRHPPPGFDKWYEFARERNSLTHETLFDQIYEDLEPFWALPAKEVQESAQQWPYVISIRNGNVARHTPEVGTVEPIRIYMSMFREFSKHLPDVDFAINTDDMPHVIVPWKEITLMLDKAKESRHVREPTADNPIIDEHAKLPQLSGDSALPAEPRPFTRSEQFWHFVRSACPPTSPVANTEVDLDFTVAKGYPPHGWPAGSYQGYVSNWTVAKSVCEHAHLRQSHGNFIKPTSNVVNTQLFPMFSGCKIQGISNDILLPSWDYWSDRNRFSGGNERTPWEYKKDKFSWHGSMSGGQHDEHNWRGFHRQRFLAMMNRTWVELEEERATGKQMEAAPPQLFPLPDPNKWDLAVLASANGETISDWMTPIVDVGFFHFLCNPWHMSQFTAGQTCKYMDSYYRTTPKVTVAEQFHAKYLPDIDGQAWSARYRGYLRSESLPIKATIYAEWHDSRLVPWKHFVPMDNSFVDLWGIMDYFVGYSPHSGPADQLAAPGKSAEDFAREGHDAVGKRLAYDGQEWADKVLRHEDMAVYVYRLVLEYARICDERREQMGYVGICLDRRPCWLRKSLPHRGARRICR